MPDHARDPDEARPTEETTAAEHPQLPSLSKMGKTFARSMGRAMSAAARGRNPIASDHVAHARARVCRQGSCGHHIPQTDRCAACGCYVSAKVRIATERCPKGLWEQVDPAPAATEKRGGAKADETLEKPLSATAQCERDEVEDPDRKGGEDEGVPLPAPRRVSDHPAVEDPPIELTGVTVVAYVSPETCKACQALGEVFRAVSPTASAGGVALRMVDVDATPGLAKKYNLEAVPTVFFYRDGRFVARIEGWLSEGRLRKMIADIMAGREIDEAASSAPPLRNESHDGVIESSRAYNHPTRKSGRTVNSHTSFTLELEIEQTRSELARLGGGRHL